MGRSANIYFQLGMCIMLLNIFVMYFINVCSKLASSLNNQIVIQIKLLHIWICIIFFFSYFSYFVQKRKAWLNFTLYRPLLKYSRPVRHDLKVDWSFLLNLNKKMNLNILPKLYVAFYKFILSFISGKLWFSTQKIIFYYIASLLIFRQTRNQDLWSWF